MEVIEELPGTQQLKRCKPPPPTMPKSVAALKALKEVQSGGAVKSPKHRPPKPSHPKPNNPSPPPKRPKSAEPPTKKPQPALRTRKSFRVMSSRPTPPQPPPSRTPGQPVPTPRKRGPPPKPAPYRQHKEHQAKEITTFKSNVVVQPQLRSHPPVPAERKQNRVSLKGEPSEQFFQPKQHSQAPVQYGIPIIPKSLVDKRPRLDTPKTPPDPDIVLTSREGDCHRRVSASESDPLPPPATTTAAQKLDTPPLPEARPRLDTPFPDTSPSPEPCVNSRPRLDTPHIPPDPAAVLPAHTKASAPPGVSPLRNGLTAGNKTDPPSVPNGNNTAEAYAYAVIEEDKEDDASYAIVDLKKRVSVDNSKNPAHLATKSSITTPLSATPSPPSPLPARSSDSELTSPSPTQTSPLTPSSLPATPPVQDTEYSSTSHTKGNSRPSSATPLPAQTPPTLDTEYHVTTHALSPSPHLAHRSPVPLTEAPTSDPRQEYSHISIPSPAPCLKIGDEYDHLDSQDKRVEQEPEYELVTPSEPPPPPVTSQLGARQAPPKKPPRRSPKVPKKANPSSAGDQAGASITPKPSPRQKESSSVKPKPLHPPPTPKQPPATPPKPYVAPPTVTMTKPSPPPTTKLSSSPPAVAVKPSSSPPTTKPRAAAPPPRPKVKPPPLSMQAKRTSEEERVTLSDDSCETTTPCLAQISPKVELDIDSIVRARKAQRNGAQDHDCISVDSFDNLAYEPKAVADIEADSTSKDEGPKQSYENQEVAPIDSQMSGTGYILPLSPSEKFTVPQHAVPGPLNYCEMDVSALAQPTVLSEPTVTTAGGEGVTSSSRGHTDAHGYCHIDLASNSGAPDVQSRVPGPEKNARTHEYDLPHCQERENHSYVEVPQEREDHSYVEVPQERGGDHDYVEVPSSDAVESPKQPDESPTTTVTPSGNAIAPNPSVGDSNTDIPVQEVVSKPPRQPPPKPPRPPSSDIHSRTPSSDANAPEELPSSDNRRTSEAKGTAESKPKPTTGTPPRRQRSANPAIRRRVPPPPPPPTNKSNVISSGLCTLPRSSPSHRSSKKPPLPTGRRKSEEVLSNSPAHKQFPPLPQEPPPGNHDNLRGSNKLEPASGSSSPGLKKKFMGFLKKSSDLRQSSRRKKQKDKEELTQSLSASPSASSKSLPRSMHGVHAQSFDAEDEDEELGGIYSTIKETLPAGSSLRNGQQEKRGSLQDKEEEEEEDVPVTFDEAGYDVIAARPTKKSKSKQSPKKKPSPSLAHSHSAEHLYEPTDFSSKAGRENKTTDNSPAGSRPSLVPQPLSAGPGGVAGGGEGSEAGPDLDAEMEQNHVYAQIVKKAKKKKSDKGKEVLENGGSVDRDETGKDEAPLDDDSVPPPLPTRDEGADTPEAGGVEGAVPGPDVGAEAGEKGEEVPTEDIEHLNSGTHMYAMVSNVSRKKSKSASLDRPVPQSDRQQEETKKEANDTRHSDPAPSPQLSPATKPRSARPTPPKPPARPTPFSGKLGNVTPTSPGLGAEAKFSGAWQGGEGQGVERAKSPVRQAPPPPKGTKVTPPTPTLSQSEASPSSAIRTSRTGSISSRPPAFPPPPPPPSATPSPDLPIGDDEMGDHTYAVVDQSQSRTQKLKKQVEAKDATAAEKLVHMDNVLPPGNRISRAQHTYSIVEEGERSSERKESIPVKSSTGNRQRLSGSRKQKDRNMKSQPSLPPRHTPPPPPPPSTAAASSLATPSYESKGNEVGGRGDGLLFSPTYASNWIKVGGSVEEQQEEDSDAGSCYSTEWETSSNGEEEEEEEESMVPRPPRSKTYHIAQEILSTERTFVKGLTLIDKDFRQAMRSANNAHEKPVISEENLKLILGNVGSILVLHSGLLEELETRMLSWDERPLIGDILLGRAPYFKIYTEYISRFDNALKMLEEQKKNSLFSQVLCEFESQPKCANIPVAGYMLDVVQRITRYKLLFADYVKHLPEDSMDRIPSEKALEIVSQVATHVNETIRQMDNFRKVVEVRKKLVGDAGETLITPSRKLLKEGELVKFSRREKQPRMFFLFNDILIYASAIPPTNNTYKVIKRIPVEGMKVDLLDDPEMNHAFQIISTCKSFWLEASNEKERMKWFEAFEKAIKEQGDKSALKLQSRLSQAILEQNDETDAAPLGSFAPPWLPDSSVSMCQLCSFNFTMTRRRHHCRGCGMIFCGDCSSYSAPLKYKSNKMGRVCQTCFEKLGSSSENKDDKSPTKRVTKIRKHVSLPAVLKEMRARDQSAQMSGYLHCSTSKTKHWKKKRWFVVYDLVLYEFERHEDVSAKRSVTLPSYQVISPIPGHDDLLVFCLKHPGMGKEYFKADTEEQLDRFVEVLRKAVVGETCTEDTTSSQSPSSTSHTPTHPNTSSPPPSSQPSSRPLTPHPEQAEGEGEDEGGRVISGDTSVDRDNHDNSLVDSFDSS